MAQALTNSRLRVPEGLAVLRALSWIHMRQPLTVCLQGEERAGAMWLYRRDDQGHEN